MNRRNIIKSLCAAPLMAVPSFGNGMTAKEIYFDQARKSAEDAINSSDVREFWVDKSEPEMLDFLKKQFEDKEYLYIEVEHFGVGEKHETTIVKFPSEKRKHKIALISHDCRYRSKTVFADKWIKERLNGDATTIHHFGVNV